MKTKSLFLLILPALLIAGLLLAGMNIWDDPAGSPLFDEQVENVLTETFEENCFCSLFLDEIYLTGPQAFVAFRFIPHGCSTIRLDQWMVPLRI